MKPEQKMVLYDSDEAAKLVTVTGWVSRHGHFYGDGPGAEHIARWDGCTHLVCGTEGCDTLVSKNGFTICEDCKAQKEQAAFEAMPKQVWDGVTPLCIHGCDEYFFSCEELDDYCHDNDVQPADLQLVICTPNYVRGLDEDCFGDLPEDCDLEDVSKELQAMIEEINTFIVANKPVLSWSPGKVAAVVASETEAADA